jgi:hypothetical protein
VIDAGWVIAGKKGAALLEIECYGKLTKRQSAEVEEEGLSFLRFMEPDAQSWDVRLTPKA